MKKSVITILAIIITALSAQAQDKSNKEKLTSDINIFLNVNDSVKAQIGMMHADYYRIKDALVKEDDKSAGNNAKEFRKTLERVNVEKMDAAQQSFFIPVKEKLDKDAEHIQGSSDIEHMRERFVSFSENMWAVVKSFNAGSGKPIYWVHCPMYKKGANWMSSEAPVKNPYYGKKMLTCGKITETIK
ncbi:MAG TPA: DUF3347 domain-containing protein [Bacteroidia bacterium]|nr:DUF3347 domain-containing protein [Bacteroidia bacterium]